MKNLFIILFKKIQMCILHSPLGRSYLNIGIERHMGKPFNLIHLHIFQNLPCEYKLLKLFVPF